MSRTRKRGNAQRDGRPLGGPVNYGQWVGQNSGPIFLAVCRPKYTKLSLPVRNVRSLQRRFPTDE